VADGLDVVAVGIPDVGGVVGRVVVLPQAGGAVVRSPGGQRSFVEGVHRRAVARRERYVPAADRVPPDDAEARHLPLAEAEELAGFEHQRVAEWFERVGIERLAALEIGDVDGAVVDRHGGSSR
jgi:hypothetical protein